MGTRAGVLCLVAIVITTVAAFAFNREIRTGDIVGTVADASGNALPGATVTLTGLERRTAVTDTQGAFAFKGLLPGAYEVCAALPRFSAATVKIALREGRTERAELRLQPGTVAEQVDLSRAARVAQGVGFGYGGGTGGGSYSPTASSVYLPGRYAGPFHTEAYDHLDENPFRRVATDPLSTFSIDVDTASYANVRRFLNQGVLPPPGAVLIEELINYFGYDYPAPDAGAPFSVTTELSTCPWNPKHRLALVGLKGRDLDDREPAPRNLVFLIDVSGSMAPPDKLPLVRGAMRMLTSVLTARDRIAIVVYAGASGLVLPSTPGHLKGEIHDAIERLESGGSTNGAAGIRLAYQVARDHFIKGGVNRVVLATDGDFNVGITSQAELVRLIEEERASGVFLSVLGVGTGNLKDSTMERLADKGNGNYAYLDSLHEARKVLVREAGGTLVTIAKDVKIQVEFNPRHVAAYRLIGYENRLLRHEEFNDDAKDAGEIGAGHSVTALYEIVPVGVETEVPGVDPLKYQRPARPVEAGASDEVLTVKLRYKAPDGETSRLLEAVVRNRPLPMSANVGFASAVAEAGMLLRRSKYLAAGSYAAAAARARTYRRDDRDGYRAEFVRLVELASTLTGMETSAQLRR